MTSIFISYAKEDYDYALEIFDFLKEEGFEPWMDKKNLMPGQDWDHVLAKTLKQVDFILIVISEISVSKRGYVQREFKRALEYWEERPQSDIYILPVKINECEVPAPLNRFHWIEFESEDFREKILASINSQVKNIKEKPKSRELTKPKMKSAPTTAKGAASSSETKTRVIWLLVLLTCGLVGFWMFNTTNGAESKDATASEKEKVLGILEEYFDNLESESFADRSFAEYIDTFYTKSNLDLSEVKRIRQSNTEFIGTKHEINKSSLHLEYEINGIRYWKFQMGFICFRRSMQKYEAACVNLTFGFNKDGKITSIIEKVDRVKFTKERPNIDAEKCE